MKLKNFLYLLILLASSTTFANGTVSAFHKRVKDLTEKNYDFFAYKQEKIHYLTGKNRFKKISFFELVNPKSFQEKKYEIDTKGIAQDILYFSKEKYRILIRKNKKFYELKSGEFKKFDPVAMKASFNLEPKITETFKKVQCKYCTFKLSVNLIRVDDIAQINSEIAWLPYYKLTETTGLRFSIGVSPYFLENNDLETVQSFAIKSQVLLRQYFNLIFVEIGGGTHYFFDYQDFSTMATTGIGYTFKEKRWLFKESISFNSFFFHASTVSWVKIINEVKLGIGFSF
jgi:hypothetical protein